MSEPQRKSILCPNCRKLISSDEPECPYCGIKHPGSPLKNNAWTQGMLSGDQPIQVIIALSAIMYVVSLALGMGPQTGGMFRILSPSNESLFVLGATGTFALDQGRWWSLLASNYLHGSLMHIAFNMFALYQLGPLVINEYGSYRMVILYTLTGIIGFWFSSIVGVPFTVGASAAVCGMIGAILYYAKSRGGQYGDALYRQVGGWVIGLAIFGLMLPGINNWAHGGGIVSGIALGFLLGYNERRRETFGHKALAGLCVVATVGTLAWAVLGGFVILF